MKMNRKLVVITCIALTAAIATSYFIGFIIVGLTSQVKPLTPGQLGVTPLPKEAAKFGVVRTVTATATATTVRGVQEYSAEAAGRMLVKTASLELESEDPEAAANKISMIVESYGGYVARLSISGQEKKSAVMTVKVPESVFYDALNDIRKVGRVANEEVNVKDVTEQHVDLDARLRNLKAEEEWLLAAVEKAKTVEDLMMIEKELWRVRGEIERVEAQLKNLDRMISYSAISIWIRTPEEVKPKPSPYPVIDFTPVIVAAVTALIYVAYGLVFLIIVGVPVGAITYSGYIIYRRIIRKKT